MKNRKITISLLTILVCLSVLFLSATTYSWIKRDWTPQFYSDELTVQTAGSLAIMLDGESATYDQVDLNDVLGLGNTFRLKQVSSFTGKSADFFSVDYSNGYGYEKLTHVELASGETSYQAAALRNGYIEGRFLIVGKSTVENATTYTKYIFFDSEESYVNLISGGTETAKASSAIRISITIEGTKSGGSTSSDSDVHFIFKKEGGSHRGATNATDSDGNYIANGQSIYILDGSGSIQGYDSTIYSETNDAKQFSDYNGYSYDSNNNLSFDKTKVLFQMSNIEQRWITIRVWLEGYDESCTNDISGSKISLKIVFNSKDVNENDS